MTPLLPLVFFLLSALPVFGAKKVIDCKVVRNLAGTHFITIPVPFSDDLLTDVLGRTAFTHWRTPGRPRMTAKEMADYYATYLGSPGIIGDKLKEVIAGKRFIDLGCGPTETSVAPRIVAEAFGAKEYIGVDLRNKNETRSGEFEKGGTFTSTFVKQDISDYLSDQKGAGGNVFYLSGIEAKDSKQKEASEYATAVKRKLRRLSATGDAVIVGSGTSNFDSIPGFTLLKTPGTQRIFIRDADK